VGPTDWLDLHAGAVGAVATGVVGIFAIFAWRANARIAKATRVEAAATRLMVEEVRRDRELAYMPYLTFRPWPMNVAVLEVTNIGRGPAVDCRACRADSQTDWTLTGPFALGAGESIRLFRGGMQMTPPAGIFPAVPHADVLFCRDQLGAVYRFDEGGGRSIVVRPSDAPKEWVIVWDYARMDATLLLPKTTQSGGG
jgi:hypothetical protein